MCGRYTLTVTRPELEQAFGQVAALPNDRIFSERFNVAPSQEVLAISRPKGSEPTAELMRWGLVPHWASDPDSTVKMINARAETVSEKPSYRNLIASSAGRCLIPADGFYECEGAKGSVKQPWRFTLNDNSLFAFAGLCTTWQPPEGGEPLRSLTIITTEPNDLVRPIHDRMPAMLADQQSQSRWLDPACDAEAARRLLVPCSAERMAASKAARAVGKPGNEGSHLLEPEQPGLF